MKEKVFPSFWQVILIIALMSLSNMIIYAITMWLLAKHNFSTFYQTVQVIAIVLNFIPYIIYLVKKTNTRLIDYLALPDVTTLIKLIKQKDYRFITFLTNDAPRPLKRRR